MQPAQRNVHARAVEGQPIDWATPATVATVGRVSLLPSVNHPFGCPPSCSQMKPRPSPTTACAEIGPSTSSTAKHVLSSLRRVGTRLGDLAILNRGCAGDTDGSDNLAIHDEGNTTLQRRRSAEREYAHTDAALRH